MIELTKEDWVEIYYALDSKLAIADSDFEWRRHILAIIEKIGPDGQEMYQQMKLLEGAAKADEERLIKAAEKAGIVYMGCDTPDWLAERILELEREVKREDSVD